MGVPYRLVFTDDDPGCVSRYGIARAPCLVIDDHIVYHGSMSEPDLGVIFAGVRRGGKNGPANIYSVCTNESSGGEPCGMTV